MASKISPENFWKLYKNLPADLKEALSSVKTGEDVFDICQRNNLPESAEEVLDYVSLVLLGLLSPEDLPAVLQKELKIDSFSAKRLYQEIFRLVFFPVKTSLENLSRRGGEAGKVPEIKAEPQKEKTQRSNDIYREPVEE